MDLFAAEGVTAILTDPRLTADARLLLLYIRELGPGDHHVGYARYCLVLDQCGEKRVRNALRSAVLCGWLDVDNEHTGRRPPRVRLLSPSSKDTQTLWVSREDTQTDSFAPPPGLPKEEGAALSPSCGDTQSTPQRVSPSSGDTQTAPHVCEQAGFDVVGDGDGDDGTPSMSPPLIEEPIGEIELHARTVLTNYAALFNGCSGALRDYLARRVPYDAQYGYVQTVRGWLEGGGLDVWRTPTGRVPKEDRTKKLADALNQLLADPKGERDMKRPPGDPGNLMTKLSVLQPRGANGDGGSGKQQRNRRGASPAEGGGDPGAGAGGEAPRNRFGVREQE